VKALTHAPISRPSPCSHIVRSKVLSHLALGSCSACSQTPAPPRRGASSIGVCVACPLTARLTHGWQYGLGEFVWRVAQFADVVWCGGRAVAGAGRARGTSHGPRGQRSRANVLNITRFIRGSGRPGPIHSSARRMAPNCQEPPCACPVDCMSVRPTHTFTTAEKAWGHTLYVLV
jgi:hypothetical protein